MIEKQEYIPSDTDRINDQWDVARYACVFETATLEKTFYVLLCSYLRNAAPDTHATREE